MSNNPLMDFARKAELQIKLPSNKNWYRDGMIEYNIADEISVYPMTPKDELKMLNPDALLSGDAISSIIESCCPQIHNANELLYPDANILILAIRAATYGNKLDVNVYCPKCYEKIKGLSDEEVKKLNEDKVVCTDAQENFLYADELLAKMDVLESEYVIAMDNGLKIYISPTPIKEKMHYELINFNQNKLIQQYKDYDIEKTSDEDKLERERIVSDIYSKITIASNQLVADSIVKIELPDGSYVSDRNNILEYVSQIKSPEFYKIHDEIKKLNDKGLPKTFTAECACCGHTWEEKIPGYNPSDFFAYGS